ncbi:hypothetical protein [Streptomyces mirabilis]
MTNSGLLRITALLLTLAERRATSRQLSTLHTPWLPWRHPAR